MQKIKNWALNYHFIFYIFVLLAVGVSLQRYLPAPTFEGRFTFYNNFILFKSSILHLLDGKDMYVAYENEGAWDLYKYSPTFAVFMLPYAYLPALPGLILWNLTNILLLYFAIKWLPYIDDKSKKIMLWFIVPELLLSAQSSQSNGIIAALFLLAYSAFEKNKIVSAVLCIGIATCIKPYAAILGFMFLFYPGKLRFVLSSITIALILLALPLAITSFANVQSQYKSWFNMMSMDFSNSTGLSVMALVNDITGSSINKNIIMALGTLITFSTVFFYRIHNAPYFRVSFVALLLLWVVIFNHKSESPTFIIPIVGVALWYFSREYNPLNLTLLLLVLVFSQLSSSDIFPAYIRHEIFEKIHIKVIPCFLVWGALIISMYRKETGPIRPERKI